MLPCGIDDLFTQWVPRAYARGEDAYTLMSVFAHTVQMQCGFIGL